jgi:outer membrane lipoprotein SlyB
MSTFTSRKLPRATTLALTTTAAALMLAACAGPVTRTTRIYEAPGVAVAPAVHYGTVQRIEVIETTQQAGGGGAVLGALVGGVFGNQVGHGSGRAAATALGAFGGAVLGDKAEHDQAAANSGTVYRVTVQFDDGRTRRFDYGALNGLQAGERVRLQGGQLDRA